MNIFEEMESNVRAYCRHFTDTFTKAKGAIITSQNGEEFIDFLAGAGALNYGHNNDFIKERIISYVESDGMTHGLDMYTTAKSTFLKEFSKRILKPRDLNYKVQFCGPTGTNAVEAALKLARKNKNREGIFSFMGGFHGVSLGSLAVTGCIDKRKGAGKCLNGTVFLPYPHGFMNSFDTIEYIETILKDDHSGIEKPAAIIFETVQAEGGVIVAPIEWLKKLQKLCVENDILLICDEIQAGCGRTGTFFSFERAGIVPDIVLLSKSISGYGLPMSILLMKPELDIWSPAEHNGTFRGNQLAFEGATAALEYREKFNLEEEVKVKESFLKKFLIEDIGSIDNKIEIRGLGMIWGIDLSKFQNNKIIETVISKCYENRLIVENTGRRGAVIKIIPPLTIELDLLEKGCTIIKNAIKEAINTL